MGPPPDLSLAPRTTLRLGGPARALVEASSTSELIDAVRNADGAGEQLLLLGSGSNLVIGDAGFAGTVVQIATRGLEREPTAAGERWTVSAGEPWDRIVELAVADGLSGLETLAGIPGLVGATPIQNVGAYSGEVAETIESVELYDRRAGSRTILTASQCGFGYRTSRFKRDPGNVVLAVTFSLARLSRSRPIVYGELARALGIAVGESAPIGRVREAVLELRRSKGMVLDPSDHDTWSAGSFFTNPVLGAEQWRALAARCEEEPPRFAEPGGNVKTSAAWLIEHAGFARGFGAGRARISGKHTLALTNRGGATTAELLELAHTLRAGVEQRFGVRLQPEPVLVGCEL